MIWLQSFIQSWFWIWAFYSIFFPLWLYGFRYSTESRSTRHLRCWVLDIKIRSILKFIDIVSDWLSNQISILKVILVLDFELRGRSILRWIRRKKLRLLGIIFNHFNISITILMIRVQAVLYWKFFDNNRLPTMAVVYPHPFWFIMVR